MVNFNITIFNRLYGVLICNSKCEISFGTYNLCSGATYDIVVYRTLCYVLEKKNCIHRRAKEECPL